MLTYVPFGRRTPEAMEEGRVLALPEDAPTAVLVRNATTGLRCTTRAPRTVHHQRTDRSRSLAR